MLLSIGVSPIFPFQIQMFYNLLYLKMNSDLLADLQQLDESSHSQQQQTIENLRQQYMVVPSQASTLLSDPKFQHHLSQIQHLINHKLETNSLTVDQHEYHLITKSNEYAAMVTREIAAIAKFIKGVYSARVPELENIVTNDIEYAKCVAEIEGCGEEKPKFEFLSPHQSISLTLTLSAPSPKLPQATTNQVMSSCQSILLLQQHHNLLLMYVQSCMHKVAPNLCRLVGSSVASKLISCAGGIDRLAAMPACNIQVLGSEKTPTLGFGMVGRNHMGFFGPMDIVRKAPNKWQVQLVRMLSTNVAKCARVDALRTCPSGNQGDKIREQVLERFEKVQEAGQQRLDKALPIPDEQPKKRRGGKRHRKRKEAMGMTEVNKYANRMKFGEAEEEVADGVGLGMLGNMGKVRVHIKKTPKLNPGKKILQVLKKNQQSGLQSSLAFTPVQGIQLINPSLSTLKKGTQTYFNKSSGFKTVLEQKLRKMQ